MRLVEPGSIAGGRIVFEGRDLLALTEKEMCRVRGARIGIAFQEPAAALDPVMRIGWQVAESLRIHEKLRKREAWDEAVRLLRLVALPDPERNARAYPHELSGGMKQRVMLAIALSCSPALLIADEPTSALDVTIQAQLLALLRRLRQELQLTVLLIAHDMGVVAENADRVGVMYAGQLVEEAPVEALFADPRHPYTQGLLRAVPGAREPGGDRRLATLPGSVPDPAAPPPGCRFHPRCAARFAPCDHVVPADLAIGPARRVRCLLYEPSRHGVSAGEPAP
jgi:oligopeptide/dipeptide ABC transporter ATP-binding protein